MTNVLDELKRIAAETYQEWDSDNDSRVGKLLAALAGYRPKYRADIDALHAALEASAARQGSALVTHDLCPACIHDGNNVPGPCCTGEKTDEELAARQGSASPQVTALSAKWREHASDIPDDIPVGLPWEHGLRLGVRRCADELDAALKAQGEASGQEFTPRLVGVRLRGADGETGGEMRRHCETCDCEPERSVSVRKSTCAEVGHCNFCNRNIDAGGTISFSEVVYELRSHGGGGLIARLCDKCMRSLVGQVGVRDLVGGRK